MTRTERDATIIEMAAKRSDLTYGEIANAFGMSATRVQQIAVRAGVVRGPDRRIREDEKAAIRSLHARGMPIVHIAQEIGRSALAVRQHLVAMGLHRPENRDTPWSAVEVELVRSQYGKFSARILAQQLGRTRDEVIGKAYRLRTSEARVS